MVQLVAAKDRPSPNHGAKRGDDGGEQQPAGRQACVPHPSSNGCTSVCFALRLGNAASPHGDDGRSRTTEEEVEDGALHTYRRLHHASAKPLTLVIRRPNELKLLLLCRRRLLWRTFCVEFANPSSCPHTCDLYYGFT